MRTETDLVTDNLPRVAIIDIPEDLREDGHGHAVAITMEIVGAALTAIAWHEEVERFVERVRRLRKRSSATLFYMVIGDGHADIAIKRITEGYICTFDFIRAHHVAPDGVVGEYVKRSIHLSDDQMGNLLDKLEHAAKEANVEYVDAA